LKALNVPFGEFPRYPYLACLFNDCGGYAIQVVSLVRTIQTLRLSIENLVNLSKENAQRIFTLTMSDLGNLFGIVRWHAIYASDLSAWNNGGNQLECETKEKKSFSFFRTSSNLITKVMLYALAKKPILDMYDVCLPEARVGLIEYNSITWKSCQVSGMIDFENTKVGYIAKCSIFSILLMNNICNPPAIPMLA
jgi:hypothetical protein